MGTSEKKGGEPSMNVKDFAVHAATGEKGNGEW